MIEKIKWTAGPEEKENIRGITFYGGVPDEVPGVGKIVRFEYPTIQDGGKEKRFCARVEGRPELQKLMENYESELEEEKIKNEKIESWKRSIFLPELERIRGKFLTAQADYERASEWGYSAREANIRDEAFESLRVARKKYPIAAAYLYAESFSLAANYGQAAAGNRALSRLESGEDYQLIAREMEEEWTEAAHKAVLNS